MYWRLVQSGFTLDAATCAPFLYRACSPSSNNSIMSTANISKKRKVRVMTPSIGFRDAPRRHNAVPARRITRRGFAHRGRSRASDETIVPVPGVRAAMTVSQRLRRDARVRRERCRVILAPRAPRASARPERRRRPASVLPGF